VQRAERIEDEDREAHAPEQVRRARARRDPSEIRIAYDPVEPFLDLGPHPCLCASLAGAGQLLFVRIRNRKTVETTKLTGVREDRVRSREAGDQAAPHARPCDLRDRDAELELGVAFDQMIAVDELGEIRLVCDIERP